MFRRLSTRGRVIITAIILPILLFITISPLGIGLYEYFLPPSDVKNILLTQRSGAVRLEWQKNNEFDIKGYKIVVNGVEDFKDQNTNRYDYYDLSTGVEYNFKIYAVDSSDKLSNAVSIDVIGSDKYETKEFNKVSQDNDQNRYILTTASVFSVILLILTIWILFFKFRKLTVLTIGAFPSIAIFPYLVFTISVLVSLNVFTSKLLFSIVISLGASVLIYLLTLTANILNGSLYNKMPLEQAGKASQFIFALLASYLILIYSFGSYQGIPLRLIFSIPFIFYFTYSAIWTSTNSTNRQILLKSLVITLTMSITLIILSVWPIDSVYAILSASVILYILLNIALEVRSKLNRTVWVEYIVLISLVIILLFSNGSWGVNGTMI